MNHQQHVSISHISFALPEQTLSNMDIEREFPEWSSKKVFEKIGIETRHIAKNEQTASDLAFQAAEVLFTEHPEIERNSIDLLVFCTQSPDYVLPTSACILQDRLSLPITCAAFDFNLGCSGYVYGLSIIKGMLESGQCQKALFLTGETYSKWMSPTDLGVRTIFGDAGTATLLEMGTTGKIAPFVFGTDGSGAHKLIVHGHAARQPENDPLISRLPKDHVRDALFMDGPEIYVFTLEMVPAAFRQLLRKSNMAVDDLDYVIFHQANTYMLEQLRRYCKIPEEKFVIDLKSYGNTVSNTIPIVLANMTKTGKLKTGMKIALVGFGVGFSWGACIVDWK